MMHAFFRWGWVGLIGAFGWGSLAVAEYREWTNASGDASFRGALDGVEGEQARIRRETDRVVFTVPLVNLSEGDQEWIRDWVREQKTQAEVPSLPKSLDWPRRIRMGPDYAIEVVEENRAENRFVYRSNHFEFISDVALARGVVREFGQIFEGTYLSVEAMPLRWNPTPPEGSHFRVRLFGEREAYYQAGGTPNSGGIYSTGRREILVPLTSVGMRRLSATYTFDPSADFRILVHEVTHQVHHDWLSKLNVWLAEGLAVYMESIPYERGVFRFDRQDMEGHFLERTRRNSQFVPLERMFEMTYREWSNRLSGRHPETSYLYATAFLMAYYFFHLDDDGGKMYAYLRAIENGQPETEARELLLDGRDMETLTRDFVHAFSRQGLRLTERPPDGT